MDTGAARTAVTSAVWDSYCHHTHRPTSVVPCANLRSLSGDLIHVMGTGVIRLFNRDITVFVVKDLMHDFILGDDALRTLDGSIELQHDCVYLCGQKYTNIGIASDSMCVGDLQPAEDYWRQRFSDLFGDGPDGPLGCHPAVEFSLQLEDHAPISQRPYRVPLLKRHLIEEQVEELLQQGIIRPSHSPWASPVTLQPKKDGTLRFCIDYRRLNKVTLRDSHPLPRIQDILDSLAGCGHFSTLDLRSGYYQIPVAEDTVPYTAFVTHSGLYEFLRMPFGLKTAPAVFQRCMQAVLGEALGRCCLVYLDDLVVFSRTAEEHEEHVRTVLTLLQDAGFTVKASKCTFSAPEVKLLGFHVSGEGVRPDGDKVAAIRDMLPPTNIRAVRRFLGMAGFHRAMIPDFSRYASLLTDLTKKHARWTWTEQHQSAFDYLRTALISDQTVLHHPDLNRPYELYTDASETAIGAVLVQRDDNQVSRPIQFISKTLNDTQRRWPALEREAYAVVYALRTLRPYLYGAEFRIFTDHKPLKAMFVGEVRNTKVQRWAMLIAEHGAPIEYVKGIHNIKADFLSRMQVGDIGAHQMCDISLAPPGHTYYVGRLSADGIDPALFREAQDRAFPTVLEDDSEFTLFENFICTLRRPAGGLEYPRLWVPAEFQDAIGRHYHQLLGHAGTRKMLSRISESYKWPSMWRSVQTVYEQCALCRVYSERVQRPPPTQMPIANSPGDLVAFDLIGPFPSSPHGNRYVITALDHCTGWVECHPIPAKTQEQIFRFIANDYIPRHGAPRVVLTDQGLEFRGQDLRRYFIRLGITHKRSTPFHPQTNGRLERSHRTLKQILRKLTNAKAEEWEDHLSAALYAYRCTPGVSGFTPYFLHYGREPEPPLHRLLSSPSDIGTQAVERYDHLATAFQQAARNVQQSRRYNHARLQRQANAAPLSVGDTVLVKVNERVTMDPRWDHKYLVTAIRGSVISVTDQRTGHRKVLNRDKLLPVTATGWEGVNPRVKRASRPPRHTLPPPTVANRQPAEAAPRAAPRAPPPAVFVQTPMAAPPAVMPPPMDVDGDAPIAMRTRKRACADWSEGRDAKRHCTRAFLSVLAALSICRHHG